jgi:anti-sigma B factor antagonist
VAEESPFAASLSIITTRPGPESVRVHVAGEIDLATARQLQGTLLAEIAAAVRGTEVRVDLARVTFIDATGVGVLVRCRQAAREAALDFSVHNPQGMVQRIIDMLGLVDLLGITPA